MIEKYKMATLFNAGGAYNIVHILKRNRKHESAGRFLFPHFTFGMAKSFGKPFWCMHREV